MTHELQFSFAPTSRESLYDLFKLTSCDQVQPLNSRFKVNRLHYRSWRLWSLAKLASSDIKPENFASIVTNLLEEEISSEASPRSVEKLLLSTSEPVLHYPITPTLFNHIHNHLHNNNHNHNRNHNHNHSHSHSHNLHTKPDIFDGASDSDELDDYISDISSDAAESDTDEENEHNSDNVASYDIIKSQDKLQLEAVPDNQSQYDNQNPALLKRPSLFQSTSTVATPKNTHSVLITAASELPAVTKSISPKHNIDNHHNVKASLAPPMASAIKDKRIFYIENSPSPVDPPLNSSSSTTPQVGGSQRTSDTTLHLTTSTNIATTETNEVLKRQDSLFSNYSFRSENGKSNRNRLVSSVANSNVLPTPEEHFSSEDEYTSTDISEMDDDDDDEDDDNEHDEFDDTVGDITFKKRMIEDVEDESEASVSNTNHSKLSASRKNSLRSDANSNYDDDSSEWLSITASEDSHAEDQAPPLVFLKINPERSSSTLNYMAEIDEKDEEENKEADITSTPNSPKIKRKPRSLLSGLFLNEMAHTSGSPNMKHPPRIDNGKPILKRSSTTGIITIEQNPKNDTKVKRSSIIFTKKHMSLCDISKNYPHYANELVENTLLFDALPPNANSFPTKKTGTILEREDTGMVTPLLEGSDDPNELLIRKQKSVVGLSDFNVTITNNRGNGMLSSSLSKFSPGSRIKNGDSASYEEKRHNTYEPNGMIDSNGNIKSMLSKSSRSLSGLFNVSKMKLSLTPLNRLESTFGTGGNTQASLRGGGGIDAHVAPNVKESPQNAVSNVSTPPKEIPLQSPHTHSLLSNGSINGSNSAAAHSTTAPRLSPGTTRKAMMQSELSNLLKESIIKDYKLGKVPLPDRVVPTTGPELVQPVSNEADEDDDYHSKGW